MIPFLIFAGLTGLIAWTVRSKSTGVTGHAIGDGPVGNTMMGEEHKRPTPGAYLGPAEPELSPQKERLLSLLVLFAKDKQFGPGQKQFLSVPMALEATRLAKALGLPKTSMAIRKDAPVPDDEFFPERSESIRELVVRYGTTGKA